MTLPPKFLHGLDGVVDEEAEHEQAGHYVEGVVHVISPVWREVRALVGKIHCIGRTCAVYLREQRGISPRIYCTCSCRLLQLEIYLDHTLIALLIPLTGGEGGHVSEGDVLDFGKEEHLPALVLAR